MAECFCVCLCIGNSSDYKVEVAQDDLVFIIMGSAEMHVIQWDICLVLPMFLLYCITLMRVALKFPFFIQAFIDIQMRICLHSL